MQTASPKQLTKLDWALARAGLYGLLQRSPRVLPKRSIVRFLSIGSRRKVALLCDIGTPENQPIASAIDIDRAYYSVSGQQLQHASSPIEATHLTALPREISQTVPVWLDAPINAAFALVSFTRNPDVHSVNFKLYRKPVRLGEKDNRGIYKVETMSVLESRDLHFLWNRLALALQNGEHDLSANLLERIRYLNDTKEARDLQTVLFKGGAAVANQQLSTLLDL